MEFEEEPEEFDQELMKRRLERAVPVDLYNAVDVILPRDWDLPKTKEYQKMREATREKTKGIRLDISISYIWNGKRKLLASGYQMTLYRFIEGKYEFIAKKDWNDDALTRDVSSITIAKYEAIRQCLARAIPIAHALRGPYTRIFTEDTWTSAIIKPQRGYRLGLTDKTKYIAGDTRNILVAYKAYPNHVFARGYRKEEKELQKTEGRTPYQNRFNHIKHRLRNLIDPDRRDIDSLWVNLCEVGDLFDEIADHRERKPTFHQVMMHFLRDHKKMPPSQIRRLTGIPTAQINRAANTVKPEPKKPA